MPVMDGQEATKLILETVKKEEENPKQKLPYPIVQQNSSSN